VAEPAAPRYGSAKTGAWIEIRGAREHNLKKHRRADSGGIDHGVCGVSGSGKSTLVEDILWRASARAFGVESPEPGLHRSIGGWTPSTAWRLVDQTPVIAIAAQQPGSPTSRRSTGSGALRPHAAGPPAEVHARHVLLQRERRRCEVCEGAGVNGWRCTSGGSLGAVRVVRRRRYRSEVARGQGPRALDGSALDRDRGGYDRALPGRARHPGAALGPGAASVWVTYAWGSLSPR